ncbi:MAG TPA: FtsW/RodA/SpoVE family cell cycle protein [Herpetosiphonaceae bacterium]
MKTSLRARGWQEYNPLLIAAVLLLLGISVPMVYSTTIGQSSAPVFSLGGTFTRHLIWLGIGLTGLAILSMVDYQLLAAAAIPLYLFSLVGLGMVLALGTVKGGAQSWIGSSSLSFQPTEPAKLILIITLAAYWKRQQDKPGTWRALGVSLLIILPVLGLVLLQPDFGSAMVIVGIWLVMALVADTRWHQLLFLALMAGPVAVFGWTQLKDYQRYRLQVFVDPERFMNDPNLSQFVWQTQQARLAIGNGGVGGMGLNRGIQSQLNFLPVQESDFIFAVTAEELGFIGAASVILLQLLVIWQIWRVVEQARDPFGRLLAAGVGGLLLVHCFENMGMNLIMMPMTGIPLPFVSYGGSFTLTVLAGIGLVQSVALRRRRLAF